MESFPATGRRSHFLVTGTASPVLLVGAGVRQAVVFLNESVSFGIRLGGSGTVASRGLYLPPTQGFTDTYSQDEWWAVGSGTTISGFIVT